MCKQTVYTQIRLFEWWKGADEHLTSYLRIDIHNHQIMWFWISEDFKGFYQTGAFGKH